MLVVMAQRMQNRENFLTIVVVIGFWLTREYSPVSTGICGEIN